MRELILFPHIAAGVAALLAGMVALPALVQPENRPTAIVTYFLATGSVVITAVGLAALDWERLWWLALVAVAIGLALFFGVRLGTEKPAKRAWKVRLILGTYVGLVTALLVVSWQSPWAWALPTLIGAPLVERMASLARRS